MAIKSILFLFSIFFLLANNTSAEIKSLKNNKTNVRLGPDISYPIKWKYKKKYLPVQILDKHYNWRKIKDFENDTGWIHISQLSNKKTVISIEENVLVFSKPTIFSRPVKKLSQNYSHIKKMFRNWCKVKNKNVVGLCKKISYGVSLVTKNLIKLK